MSMKTMYWVSQIYSWNYIDIAGKTHGRIDWFDDLRDVGYWWQTSHETGNACSIERAKRNVEEAVTRRRMALEARYLAGIPCEQPAEAAADVGEAALREGEPASGDVVWSA